MPRACNAVIVSVNNPSTAPSLIIQQCPHLSQILLLCLLSQQHPSPRMVQGMSCTYHGCLAFASDNVLRRVSQDALAELKALANIVQSSVEQIEAVVAANSFTFPSPDSTFSFESEAPRMHPAIQSAGSLITSAAAQLITLVRPAPLTLLDISMQVSLEVPRATNHH
jgi:hypothetical protein